jgi:cytochrome c-type protein NapB
MRRPSPWAFALGLILIASVGTASAALVVAGRRAASRDAASANASGARTAANDAPLALLAAPAVPIAAEAMVFLTRPGSFAIEPASRSVRPAHPRSLATYRGLRAYSGAPPRIPHGLTPTEVREDGCRTCHERGGFSERFGAYVPVTPHPDMGACQQCHVGDAKLMAIGLPRTAPSDRCRQCHTPGAMRWRDSTLDWVGLRAPALTRTVAGREPPPIPHESVMRGNCLACHAGPSGVAELRTPHPLRANCRQCHVDGAGAVPPFVRTAADRTSLARGGS